MHLTSIFTRICGQAFNSKLHQCYLKSLSTSAVISKKSEIVSEELNNDKVDALDADVILSKIPKKISYSSSALSELNFDKYPYYVEREWWKNGKRMTFWASWRMLRNVKQRQALQECGADLFRLKAMKKNNILPQAIRDECGEKLASFRGKPYPKLIINVCQFTGARRGKLKCFLLNRHTLRTLADHGQLSGVQRALW